MKVYAHNHASKYELTLVYTTILRLKKFIYSRILQPLKIHFEIWSEPFHISYKNKFSSKSENIMYNRRHGGWPLKFQPIYNGKIDHTNWVEAQQAWHTVRDLAQAGRRPSSWWGASKTRSSQRNQRTKKEMSHGNRSVSPKLNPERRPVPHDKILKPCWMPPVT